MVASVSRAWSSAGEAFWKKSFQTSTGYILWLCSEHFISVTKLLCVRLVALGIKTIKKHNVLANVAKAISFSGIYSLHKSSLTEEQACSVMVKLHRAVEELSFDRVCWSFDLKKTIK